MNSQEILRFCLKNGLLVDKELLNLFSETNDTDSIKLIINRLKSQTNQKIITRNVIINNRDEIKKIFSDLPEENQKNLESLKIKLGLSIEISKEVSSESAIDIEKNKPSDVRIVSMAPSVSKKLEVADFVKYFKGRISKMSYFLQERAELGNVVSINKISGTRQGFSIIGIVSDKRITKNKNMILELEDLTGKIKVLINQNKPELYEKAEEISLDSVIGVKGTGSREILFANDVIFPDSSLPERKKGNKDEYALFIGDLHIGSKLFMESNFIKFIDYLNGKVPYALETGKIKYLFVVGDLIAGVGIYPGQENELVIPDIEEQYAKAAELLSKIRSDIKIIICPGNHDSVRIMEPQPVLDEKYAWPLYNLKNVILVGNPVTINIGTNENFSGFDVLMYHGYSIHYYSNNITRLMKEKAVHNPDKIAHYLLKNRHLAPTHSSTLYFPSEKDHFIIEKIPDIFLLGHSHKSAISYYNNILVISSSSWESKTAFQEKMGNEPDFCKVPMFNLKTRSVKVLDFE
ncbi:MAG TPA: metallophosphoesterase [Candidatus Nanoarchaeia archaeon]|nr:metallophosphoesterase [Candidatus Nanoarchaeia archaeon]